MDVTDLGDRLVPEMPGLLRYARSLTSDSGRAEDLVQETLTRALHSAEQFRGEASLATWLHRILHNLAVDAARRDREVPAQDVVAEEVERRWRQDAYTVDAVEVTARAETRTSLLEAMAHLPVIYRSAVLLHDAEALTMAQIAAVQGVSLPAAKQRLRRGRMMLVSELARGHERREALKGVPLRCWEARKQVSDYIDGELDPQVARRVEMHLEKCPTCPPLYAAIVATTDGLHDLTGRDPDTVIPPALVERLARNID
ncbi:sigma-70 family RNA polymerase sigma factor [Ornithinimicrobium sediminis]|uniref:sigma-70 family RNA polymerase sigma factor n=1 Tax=Ornithinimicrobium sediminis TaxID=2904603 RepID=UPI0022B8219B|nr:sigma-70 family RNA polymerase sigma factor [Ornithinimicrobium sediminis]